MKLQFKTGDILSEDVEAVVNSVNCVGVMGRGIALQFKNAYPANFKAYAAACRWHQVEPGRMFVQETHQLAGPRWIINFPTKRHWKSKSRLEDIQAGLEDLVATIDQLGIRSIAVPPLGSGLGGLDWNEVRHRIESELGRLEQVEIVVFEPGGGPVDDRSNPSATAPDMTLPGAIVVELMSRFNESLLDPFVTLLGVHKLMYFIQEGGECMNLRFTRHVYGPYAEKLRHLLLRINGHFVTGCSNKGDAPHDPIWVVPGARQDARQLLLDQSQSLKRIDRVMDLVEGFETANGLKLLASVHWAFEMDPDKLNDGLVRYIHDWYPRKRRFSERQINLAYDVLAKKHWIAGGKPHPQVDGLDTPK
ncbi:MAG: macro domain-containing protein [Caldilineaceae bacterium]|nr:macro domain-containing protein [Caldilineaceae bacterium]